MILIWGSRLYGKVDEVPGLFYVATKFGHLWYLPLIPMGSQVILRETENGWDGVRIPLSGKSVLIAWLRTGLVLGALWSFLGGIFGGSMIFGTIGAAIAIGLFVLTKRWKSIIRCDLQRAKEIAQKAGFDEQTIIALEAHYLAMEAAFPPAP